MTRWLVTGAAGAVGTDVVGVLSMYDEDVLGCDRAALDVASPDSVQSVLDDARPDVVVNCAAYTAVDAAEDDEETAYAVNATAPALLAQACAANSAKLIHVSTDYVFPGDRVGGPPYDVDDETGPTNAYGRTKLAGEHAVRELHPDGGYVVRTAWLYGSFGANIVKTMARLEKERETVAFVADQHGSPTWSRDLAKGLWAMARENPPAGTYHCTGSGQTTWHGFAQAVFEELGADPARVQPIRTEDYPVPAPRPAYSVLSPRAWQEAGLPVMPAWRESLREAFRLYGSAFKP